MKLLLILIALVSLSVTERKTPRVIIAGSNDQVVFDNAREKMKELFSGPQIHFTSDFNKIDKAEPVNLAAIERSLSGDCFLYITSHGARYGVVLADQVVTPRQLNKILTARCPGPTMIIISACFSGLFTTEIMKAPNRTILTASAADRSSFGCTNELVYTFWDDCFLKTVEAGVTDINEVYKMTSQCITDKEKRYPKFQKSLPQLFIGENGPKTLER